YPLPRLPKMGSNCESSRAMTTDSYQSELRPEASDTGWDAVPEGELGAMVGKLHARERSRQARATAKIAGAVTLGVALLVVSVGLLQGPGAMSCSDCMINFEAFHQHVTLQQAMDDQTAQRIEQHFASCALCTNKFEQTYPGVLSNAGITLATLSGGLAPLLLLASWRRRDR
ncbi:MAG: hypothetical protein AAGF31_01350, partial [Planctomycetota bacterium]